MLANINVGLLYILAASSLGVYGMILAGWASNSKYPFYSAIRAAGADGELRGRDRLRAGVGGDVGGSFNLQTIVMSAEGRGAGHASTATASTRCCSRWRWCS